jgi:hypothetical protein
MLPTLVQQMMLVKLFIQTDPTVLPIGLVLSLISNLASLAFLAVLIVFFAIRYIPRRAPPDAKAQCRWRIAVAPLQAFPPVYRLSHNTQPQRRGEVLCLVVFPNAHASAV